jgi:hypothetical protein
MMEGIVMFYEGIVIFYDLTLQAAHKRKENSLLLSFRHSYTSAKFALILSEFLFSYSSSS